nr:zinc finger, CCHC-type [Tanacetum cinerariifolium]
MSASAFYEPRMLSEFVRREMSRPLSNKKGSRLSYVTDRPTIIFGADFTHPQLGEDSSPSIAVVDSFVFFGVLLQWTGYKWLFLYLLSHTGMRLSMICTQPQLIQKDRVIEGQFNEVLLNEMDKIRKACISLEENYIPPVTFIVVQKRNHTHFFPVRHGDRAITDTSGNILLGTVLDCHPSEFDFYLCRHAGIQLSSFYNILFSYFSFCDLDEVTLDEITGKLKAFEERIKLRKGGQVESQDNLLFAQGEHSGKGRRFSKRGGDASMWYLDNCASNHMTGTKSHFKDIDESVSGRIHFGDGSYVQIKGRGSILLGCRNQEQKIVSNVYYIPNLKSNILSLGQLTKIGCKVIMEGNKLTLYDKSKKLLMKIKRSKN